MKHDIAITRMIITYKWNTGDTVRQYSPIGKECKSRIRKRIAGFLISCGGTILFGKNDWSTYFNQEEPEDAN